MLQEIIAISHLPLHDARLNPSLYESMSELVNWKIEYI